MIQIIQQDTYLEEPTTPMLQWCESTATFPRFLPHSRHFVHFPCLKDKGTKKQVSLQSIACLAILPRRLGSQKAVEKSHLSGLKENLIGTQPWKHD